MFRSTISASILVDIYFLIILALRGRIINHGEIVRLDYARLHVSRVAQIDGEDVISTRIHCCAVRILESSVDGTTTSAGWLGFWGRSQAVRGISYC